MINMQCGEARDSFLAGIAAHDGDGVLSPSFQRHPSVVPPLLKGKKGELKTFKNDFLLKANMLDISGHFVGQGPRVVPGGDPLKQKGEFKTFKNDFLLKANMLDISGHFVGQGPRVVPGRDPLKQTAVLLREVLQVRKSDGRTKRGTS